MNQALELYPADYWRWWLLSNAPETSDSDFTWQSFQSIINKDLADVLGNFVSRLTKFTISKFGTQIPEGKPYSQKELDTISEIEDLYRKYDLAMSKIEIRKATSHLRKIWSIGNEYLQSSQPWVVIKSDKAETARIIKFGFNLMLFFGEISEPFIPETSAKIKGCFRKLEDKIPSSFFSGDFRNNFEIIKFGEDFKPIANLFKKIEDKEALDLEERFRGNDD
jgi:methionyl-tRNA synthetase